MELATLGLEAYRKTGKVNGQMVRVLRDTGCTQTMVYGSFVSQRAVLPYEFVDLHLADGSVKKVPIASVQISV